MNLDYEKLLILYECVMEACRIQEICEVEIMRVFYCGKNSKWGIPNTLLIIVNDKDVKNNRFYSEMSEPRGGSSSAYLERYVTRNPWNASNRKYQFTYRFFTDKFFNSSTIENIIDDRWQFQNLNEIVDISKDITKIYSLKVFL